MRSYSEIKGKSLSIICQGCGKRADLHHAFWNALAKQCGDDLDRMEKRLRCEVCGARGTIEAHEPLPMPGSSDAERTALRAIGDMMRARRRAKKRGELP